MPNAWFRPRGTLARDGCAVVVDDAIDGWTHTGLRVADVVAGAAVDLPAGDVERLVVPLAGSFDIDHDGAATSLAGRANVFSGPTDVLFLGAGTAATLRGSGRVAIAQARTTQARPAVHLGAGDIPVEIRGTGRDTRQVHDLGTPDVLDAAALIVCEVITPGGNWSSHPAHKHDEYVPGHESQLEEIYYFEAAPARHLSAPADVDAFGMFVTSSSPAGEIDTHATVRTGDVALVPYGYHGPAMAAPEYDLYYLNVMAGPGPERVWLISDDPGQAWVRDTWPGQEADPRLPFTAERADRR